MAFGFRCKNCGYQETSHEISNEDPDTLLNGYKLTLGECQEFTYTKQDREKVKKMCEDDDECKRIVEQSLFEL